MNKVIILALLAIVLVAGCTGIPGFMTPEDIARNSAEVKAFLAEYPRATVIATLFSNISIKEECANPQLPIGDYWKVTVSDPDTNMTLNSYIDENSQKTVCAIKGGGPVVPEEEMEAEIEEETEVEETEETNTTTEESEEEEECIPSWECGLWSDCINETQTRTCEDLNLCDVNISKPSLSQECEEEPEEIWWNSNWDYKKTVIISNSGTELTEYQIGINVNYDSNMQPDFDDIRFVNMDESTELDYWLQEKIDSSSAYFWVKVPSISSGSKKIYMYYGNSGAPSNSNIENTMIIGDDFDDGSFNIGLWLTDANSGNTVEANGILNISCGYVKDSRRRHYTSEKISTGILEGRMKIDGEDNTENHQYHVLGLSNQLVWWNDDLTSVNLNEDAWVGTPFVRYNTRNDGVYTGTLGDNPQDFQENTWIKFKIVLKSNEFVRHYKNSALKYHHTSNVPNEELFVLLSTETGQLGNVSSDFWTAYDWVFVRKYADVEPTVSICDSSYPTVCIPPFPPDLDCSEITHSNFEVLPPDSHGFDGDDDGIGCES